MFTYRFDDINLHIKTKKGWVVSSLIPSWNELEMAGGLSKEFTAYYIYSKIYNALNREDILEIYINVKDKPISSQI